MTLYTIQKRRAATSGAWSTANPILVEGQWGIEINTGRAKLGDGETHWNDLAYFSNGAVIASQIYDAMSNVFVMLEAGQGEDNIPDETPFGTPVFRKIGDVIPGCTPGPWNVVNLDDVVIAKPAAYTTATYTGGMIVCNLNRAANLGIPGLILDPLQYYEFEITNDASAGPPFSAETSILSTPTIASEVALQDATWYYLANRAENTALVESFIVGPNLWDWNPAFVDEDPAQYAHVETRYNAKISQIRWREACSPIIATSGCLDLSTAEFQTDWPDPGDPAIGQYNAGEGTLETVGGQIICRFPDFPLTKFDRTKTYKWTFTYAPGTDTVNVAVNGHAYNTNANWLVDGYYIAAENGTFDEGTTHVEATMGLEAAFYSEWAGGNVPPEYEGMTFEITPQSGTGAIQSICWEVVEPEWIEVDLSDAVFAVSYLADPDRVYGQYTGGNITDGPSPYFAHGLWSIPDLTLSMVPYGHRLEVKMDFHATSPDTYFGISATKPWASQTVSLEPVTYLVVEDVYPPAPVSQILSTGRDDPEWNDVTVDQTDFAFDIAGGSVVSGMSYRIVPA